MHRNSSPFNLSLASALFAILIPLVCLAHAAYADIDSDSDGMPDAYKGGAMIEYLVTHKVMVLSWLLAATAIGWMVLEIRYAPDLDDDERPIKRGSEHD